MLMYLFFRVLNQMKLQALLRASVFIFCTESLFNWSELSDKPDHRRLCYL